MSEHWFSVQAFIDFLWWATHVLDASVSIGGAPVVHVWLPAKPDDTADIRADVIFELGTGRVYTNFPAMRWLSSDDPAQWRETLRGAPWPSRPAEEYPCGRLDCCLFRSDKEDQ